jgi:hypothetical protein
LRCLWWIAVSRSRSARKKSRSTYGIFISCTSPRP